MKPLSKWSIGFIVLGLLLFGVNYIIDSFFEPVVLIGVIFLLLGAVFSFVAIARKEKGSLKFISLVSFFIILFLISWFEPFQVFRLITWLKNIV